MSTVGILHSYHRLSILGGVQHTVLVNIVVQEKPATLRPDANAYLPIAAIATVAAAPSTSAAAGGVRNRPTRAPLLLAHAEVVGGRRRSGAIVRIFGAHVQGGVVDVADLDLSEPSPGDLGASVEVRGHCGVFLS